MVRKKLEFSTLGDTYYTRIVFSVDKRIRRFIYVVIFNPCLLKFVTFWKKIQQDKYILLYLF